MKENYTPTLENSVNGNERAKTFRLYGFRSRKWYKMLFASIFLMMLLSLLIATLLGESEISAATTKDIALERISGLIILLSLAIPYLILSNIFNLRSRLPLYKRNRPISTGVAVFLTFMIIGLFTGPLNSLHTTAYATEYDKQQGTEQAQNNEDKNNGKDDGNNSSWLSGWVDAFSFSSDSEKASEDTPKDTTPTFDKISNNKLNENFIKACKEINLDVTKINNFEKTDDWAGGERYNFSYKSNPLTLYANGDNTINSINIGDYKLYLQGFESYSVNDFIVDLDIAEGLVPQTESTVKSYLNYPSTANFSMFDWNYGRMELFYQLRSSVEAKNAFGVESEIPFTAIYKIDSGNAQLVALSIDGEWVIEYKIPEYDTGRKELVVSTSETKFTLIDEALGTYGERVKIDSEYYVWYKVPAGTYTVTSNSKWCMVYVDKDKTSTNSDGYTEVTNVKTYEFTAANQKKTVTVGTGEHIFLTVNANVTFSKQ